MFKGIAFSGAGAFVLSPFGVLTILVDFLPVGSAASPGFTKLLVAPESSTSWLPKYSLSALFGNLKRQ